MGLPGEWQTSDFRVRFQISQRQRSNLNAENKNQKGIAGPSKASAVAEKHRFIHQAVFLQTDKETEWRMQDLAIR
jgi:hypothetical protein